MKDAIKRAVRHILDMRRWRCSLAVSLSLMLAAFAALLVVVLSTPLPPGGELEAKSQALQAARARALK